MNNLFNKGCLTCDGIGHVDMQLETDNGIEYTSAEFCPNCIDEGHVEKYRKLIEWSANFKNFTLEDEQLNLLPNFGWLDGGCRSLMKALIIWFNDDKVRPYQIAITPFPSHGEHGLVRVGDLYIDGDGIATKEMLIDRWQNQYLDHRVYLNAFVPENEPSSNDQEPFYIEDFKIKELVKHLNARYNKNEVLSLLLSYKDSVLN